MARVPAATARCGHRRAGEGLRQARYLQIWAAESDRRAPSAVARRTAPVEAARHADLAAVRRSPHAARAGRRLWRVRAFRGVAGARARWLPDAARRTVRPPAVAFLSHRFRRLGGRQANTVPAGPDCA